MPQSKPVFAFRRVLLFLFAFGAIFVQREYSLADVPMISSREQPQSPVLLPSGIAEYPSGKIGYVINAENGIDAVDLATGKLLWNSKETGQLLFADSNRLMLLQDEGDSINFLVLDASRKGALLLKWKPLIFPDWVSIRNRYGSSFSSRAYLHYGALHLIWEAHTYYSGGAAPSEEVLAGAKNDAFGHARFDLKTGVIETLPADSPAGLQAEPAQPDGTWSSWKPDVAFFVDGIIVKLGSLDKDKPKTLTFDRLNSKTNKWLKPIEVSLGFEPAFQLTPDNRYILVQPATPGETVPAGDNAMWIYSVITGKQVAKLPLESVTLPIFIVDSRLFTIVAGEQKRNPEFGGFITPRFLQATDLKTGSVLWQHPIAPEIIAPMPM